MNESKRKMAREGSNPMNNYQPINTQQPEDMHQTEDMQQAKDTHHPIKTHQQKNMSYGKRQRWIILYGILLLAFTVYISLDTFVLSSVYRAEATEMNLELFANVAAAQPDQSEETGASAKDSSETDTPEMNTAETASYEDENIRIVMQEYYKNNTWIYVADVQLSSAQYLKTAFAEDTYGKNVTETTSVIAADHQAILAINGDYYGTQESGYVIRNGVLYREESNGGEVLCIYADGTMEVVDSDEVTAQQLLEQGVWQALSFGPGLLEDGEISVDEDDEVGKAKASNPRTAIGMIDENHYVFVVSDGRTEESEGLSLYELA